ncbi:hypothetical protein [Arthrobacter sp. Soil762]|uniref:hypothetical protein n=1 Tax=Arthrobacter sp. Soil762 TaxID=1736401 RepID=UPI000A6CD6A0
MSAAMIQLTLTGTTIGFALGQLVIGPSVIVRDGGVAALAMVRDLFGSLRLAVVLSRLSLVSGLAPILAPAIGSQLLPIMNWRGIFGVLAISAS